LQPSSSGSAHTRFCRHTMTCSDLSLFSSSGLVKLRLLPRYGCPSGNYSSWRTRGCVQYAPFYYHSVLNNLPVLPKPLSVKLSLRTILVHGAREYSFPPPFARPTDFVSSSAQYYFSEAPEHATLAFAQHKNGRSLLEAVTHFKAPAVTIAHLGRLSSMKDITPKEVFSIARTHSVCPGCMQSMNCLRA